MSERPPLVKPEWSDVPGPVRITPRTVASATNGTMDRATVPAAEQAKRIAAAAVIAAPAGQCADRLREAADLLQAQGANPYRVAAYRKAADTICGLSGEAIVDLVDREGVDGLDRLPHVGRGIAMAIVEMVRTGMGLWFSKEDFLSSHRGDARGG